MVKKEIRINQLPAYTYGWLGMNETSVSLPPLAEAPAPKTDLSAGVTSSVGSAARDPKTGSGDAFTALFTEAGIPADIYEVPAGVSPKEPVRQKLRLPANAFAEKAPASLTKIMLGEGSSLTFLLDVTSAESAEGIAAFETYLCLEKGAHLSLVQVLRPGQKVSLINDIGGQLAEGAKLDIVHLFLGGDHLYQGCRIDLLGTRSELGIDIGYRVAGDGSLDMNYVANHIGKKTRSLILASGILQDRAKKLFRGTIDLKNGCAGAVGTETEDVLLMDDDVVNQTIPLILCAEEDVEGNHGASIGRLDESVLFYMQSRGMTQEAVYEMMARAKIDAVIRRIPDDEMRNTLLGEDTNPRPAICAEKIAANECPETCLES